jgi:hypothetical protein
MVYFHGPMTGTKRIGGSSQSLKKGKPGAELQSEKIALWFSA